MTKRDLAVRLARWKLSIKEYQITIIHRSGKLHINGDSLSRYPVDDPTQEEEDDPCLEIANVTVEEGDTLKKLREGQLEIGKWASLIRRLERGKPYKTYVLRNGVLYIRLLRSDRILERLCVPRYLRHEICVANHDDLISGHMGMTRTRLRIGTRYFWPRMAEDINRYVQASASCQARKGVPQKTGRTPSEYLRRASVPGKWE